MHKSPPELLRGRRLGKYDWRLVCHLFLQIATLLLFLGPPAHSADRFNIVDYGLQDQKLDRTGFEDTSLALAAAIDSANWLTAKGLPACVYVPPGIYLVSVSSPVFERAGCIIIGDGPARSIIRVDPKLEGDLFVWSEAWTATTDGPTVVGQCPPMKIRKAYIVNKYWNERLRRARTSRLLRGD